MNKENKKLLRDSNKSRRNTDIYIPNNEHDSKNSETNERSKNSRNNVRNSDPGSEKVYEVQRLEKRLIDKNKEVFYLVKWCGYRKKTWEPESNFEKSMLNRFDGPTEIV